MDKTINEIREILFKYLDIQQVPDIMNDIRGLLNKPDNNSIPLDAQVRRRTVSVEITDFDIATIEALHDLLFDKHGYELNHTTLCNARKLTHKMYEAFKSA